MRRVAHAGLGLLVSCGPRVLEDDDGSGSHGDGVATDGASASSAASGGATDDGAWGCPTTVAEPPWCYDRIELPGIEWPWGAVPVELGEGRGTGVAVFHKAGSADLWNGGPVSLVAWEDGRLILTHGDFAAPALSVDVDDIRAVRLSGNAAEDLLVYNYLSGAHFTELLVLKDDRWALEEIKPVALPMGFDWGGGPVLPRDQADVPVLLLVEENVGFHRFAYGEDAWVPTGELVAFPSWVPNGGSTPGIEYGDVDGDGDEDVLLSFFDDNGLSNDRKLALLRADPAAPGGFVLVELGDMIQWWLDLGDFDGDGRLDVLEFEGNEPFRFALRRGLGDGTFDVPSLGALHFPDGSGVLAFGDIDGDGLRDAFVVSNGTPGLGVIEHFEMGGVYRLLFPSSSEHPESTADVNGDGQLDLVVDGNLGKDSSLLISIATE